MKKFLLFSLAIAAAFSLNANANADLVITSYSTVSGANDNNQAGPMWGQFITVNVGADTADGLIPGTVYLDEVSFQNSDPINATFPIPGNFLHVYDSFTTNVDGTIATVGNLVAVSANANFGAGTAGEQLTWDFAATAAEAISKSASYMYVSASDAVAATTGNTGNLVAGGYELDTGNPYTGGDSLRANATNSGWDQAFEVKTQTVAAVPEPASLALLGMGMVGLISTRRRRS